MRAGAWGTSDVSHVVITRCASGATTCRAVATWRRVGWCWAPATRPLHSALGRLVGEGGFFHGTDEQLAMQTLPLHQPVQRRAVDARDPSGARHVAFRLHHELLQVLALELREQPVPRRVVAGFDRALRR